MSAAVVPAGSSVTGPLSARRSPAALLTIMRDCAARIVEKRMYGMALRITATSISARRVAWYDHAVIRKPAPLEEPALLEYAIRTMSGRGLSVSELRNKLAR